MLLKHFLLLLVELGGKHVSQHYIIKCMYAAYDVVNVIYSDFIANVSTKKYWNTQ